MSCTPYISCDKRESWESLFRRLIVEQEDGSLAIRTCCTTTGDDNVFSDFSSNSLTLAVTCPASLLTCNGGAPDGDLCTLNTNNTITVNGAPLAGCP